MSPKFDFQSKSFWDHLNELRRRLFISAATLAFTSVVCYFFTDIFLDDLLKPVGRVIFTSPADAFVARIQLTFILGFVAASPMIFYQIWKFVESALKEHEKTYIKMFGFLSLALFISGVVFGYKVAIPFSMNFLLGFGSERIIPMITIDNYMSFVGTELLAFGIVFEMPLVMAFLTKIGIATPAFLMQKRRHAIILILIISAIITPPDIFSQIIMAVPLLVLYEFGIVASKIVFRNR